MKLRILVVLCTLTSSLHCAAADNDVLLLPGGKSIVVPAFRTYVATGYTVSEKNVAFLRELKEKLGTPRLVTFDIAKNNSNMLLCRGSFPVYAPNKTPFATLVEAAVNMELVAAELATPEAPRIQASLNEFDFSSSMFSGGKWSINATFNAEGTPPLTVKNTYEYPVSYGAAEGCNKVMKALPAGIEAFLFKFYSDPAFLELFH